MARIADLGYGCTGSSMNIRILRKWTPHYQKTETWFLAVDEHGDSVQILGKKQNQSWVESKLELLKCYSIEDYTCTEIRPYAKFIPRSINLNLGLASIINPIQDLDTLPKTWFCFGSLEEMQQPLDQNTKHYDVVGVFRDIRRLTKSDGEPYVKLDLTHESGFVLNITLWNECVGCAHKFDSSLLESTFTKEVFAVTSLKLSDYGGKRNFNSSIATHVYLNPDIKEKASLDSKIVTESIHLGKNVGIPATIAQLNEMKHSEAKGNVFVTKCTLERVIFKDSWFSVYCSGCPDPLPKKGDSWFCITHGVPKSTSFCYSISATLNDSTMTKDFVFSDEATRKMCRSSSEDIVVKLGYDDRKILPPLLEKIRFGTYTFYFQLAKWATADVVQFIVVDVHPHIQLDQLSVVSHHTPAPLAIETPDIQSKPTKLTATGEPSSTRRRLDYEDEDESDDTNLSPGEKQSSPSIHVANRRRLVLSDEEDEA